VGGPVFLHPYRPALGPTEPPVKSVSGFFPGLKRPGRGVDHLSHLAPKLKKSRAIGNYILLPFSLNLETVIGINIPVHTASGPTRLTTLPMSF
jgi:hypothetical protein